MFLNMFKRPDFDGLLKEYENDKDAVLIDVREVDEYNEGHVPDSINIPLSQIDTFNSIIKDKNTNIYVYCLSGARSNQAYNYLTSQGYNNITNLGGINAYHGQVVR